MGMTWSQTQMKHCKRRVEHIQQRLYEAIHMTTPMHRSRR
jgi:hypothetical protein